VVRRWRSGLEVEVVGQRLIELELRHRLGLGEVERRRLIGEEFGLGWPAGRGQGRGQCGRSRCRRMAQRTGGSVRNATLVEGERSGRPP
jgi:hypothetical protein